jgi:hypothetical protein
MEYKMSALPTKRMQFEMPMRYYEAITNIKERTDSASYADAIKRAVRLHEFIHTTTMGGSEVCIRGRDGIVTPIVLLEI